MKRLQIGERENWRGIAEREGFTFHYMDGELYWDESACYALRWRRCERHLEAPTEETARMCSTSSPQAVTSDALMTRLAIPEEQRTFVAETWRLQSPSLYGRFDLAYDGSGPPSCLNIMPTPRPASTRRYYQWSWLERASPTARCRRTPTS
jgi:glutathionylspermidine synthase